MFPKINSAPQRLVEYIVSTMGFAISVAVIYTNTTIYYIDVIYFSLHHYRRHDNVIKWKHFLSYWLLGGEFTGEFPTERPVTRSVDVFFNLRLN